MSVFNIPGHIASENTEKSPVNNIVKRHQCRLIQMKYLNVWS